MPRRSQSCNRQPLACAPYHRHCSGADAPLARARNPFVIPAAAAQAASAAWVGRSADEGPSILRHRLAAMKAQLPVLYRQYADLCEPAGVRFLDFGSDPDFGGCVDGLVRLELAEFRAPKRARYLQVRER